MTNQNKGASSPLPAWLLHHVTRRRNRVYGAFGVALALLAVATWIYGGFATGIDFTTSVPRPPGQFAPAKADATSTTTSTATSTATSIAPSTDGATGTATSTNGVTGANDDATDTNGTDGATSITVATTTNSANGANGHQTQTAPVDQETSAADDDWRHSTHNPAAHVSPGIPPKIWQILLPKNSSNSDDFVPSPKSLDNTASWLAMNTDYAYTLVGQKGGDELVRSHFGSDPRIVEAYEKMPNVGMRSDLLRYLILGAVGGVYTDTDTVALKPIDKWVPADMRDKVALVVGIEFDRRDGSGWADIFHWVQFCQWTIAAAPGHPVFGKMAAHILQSLDRLSTQYEVPFEKLKPSSAEVMNSTGPAGWTEVVFQQLQEYDPSLITPQNLSFMTEPRLYGNILVLPIDGFGMGQPHSNSTREGIPEAALVQHLFKGGWRD